MADTLASVAAEWLAKRLELKTATTAVTAAEAAAKVKRDELAAISARAMVFVDRTGSIKSFPLAGGKRLVVFNNETLARMGPGALPFAVEDP